MQGDPGLAQGEVERRGFIRPGAVARGDLPLGWLGKQGHARQQLAERSDRVASREREHRSRGLQELLILGLVGDVLPETLLSGSPQVDRRCSCARSRSTRWPATAPTSSPRSPAPARPGAPSRSSLAAPPPGGLTSSSRRSSCRASPTAASSRAQSSIRVLPSLNSASVSSSVASPESRRRMISSTRAEAAS